MKNGYLKYIIPAIVILTGILIAAAGLYMGAAKDYSKSLSITDMEATVPFNSVKNLDIDVEAAKLVLRASNEVSSLTIEAENISKSNLDYSVNNGTLTFRYKVKKWYDYADMIGLLKSDGKITVLVPADSELMDIQIASGFLPLDVSYLTAERIYIESPRSDLDVKNLTADHIEINCGSSKAECSNITGKTSNLNCGSGKFSGKNINVDDLGIACGSGDMKLSGIINGDSIVSCKSGSIRMDIYKSADSFKFKTEGSDISIDGSKKLPKNNKKAKNTIDAVCGLGKIELYFNK